jgi:glutamine synthetase
MTSSVLYNDSMSVHNISGETKLVVAEYVFIDGFGKTRSKTRIIQGKIIPGQKARGLMFSIDVWNVDGSSTGQSETDKSDIILMPRALFNDPFNHYTSGIQYCLVMCDIIDLDGRPHSSNSRAELFRILTQLGENKINDEEPWFGIEQEYVIYDAATSAPYKWQQTTYSSKQGPFYCGVGGNVVFGREIAMEHMNKCIAAGIAICGINSEVAPSQWEFQIGICNPVAVADHLWMARYILARVAEIHGAYISYDPKPLGAAWNGSGAHTNVSTSSMRAEGGLEVIKSAIDKLANRHKEHMAVYGTGNERRLTGIHETSSIDKFTYGECDRGSSVRIPINVLAEGRGYFEDRRPAANADPYLVVAKILETIML